MGTDSLAFKILPARYVQKTIALGWYLSDASRVLTDSDKRKIEREAEKINNNTGGYYGYEDDESTCA